MIRLSWAKSVLLPFSLITHLVADEQQLDLGTLFDEVAHFPLNEISVSGDTPVHSEQSQPKTPTTLRNPPQIAAYNAPLLVNPNAWANVYVTGSFLYWKASADYLAYSLLNNSFSPDPADIANLLFHGETLEPNFAYKPGYKLGLGYTFHRDRWDLYTEYTCFHQTTHTSKKVKSGRQHMHAIWLVFVTPIFLGDGFRSCSSDWVTNLDILDAEVGRNFFCGRRLTFRPSLGLRTLWFEQKYDLTYVSLQEKIPVVSRNKSSSWGIGPRFALSSAWHLFGGFKVIGDVAVSLLHVEDQVTIKHTSPFLLSLGSSSNKTYANKESISLVKPILDLSFGLGWGRPLFHSKCALDLELSYDYSVYWNQGSIQLGHAPLVVPGGTIQVLIGNTAFSTGDLSIQGLTATAKFHF